MSALWGEESPVQEHLVQLEQLTMRQAVSRELPGRVELAHLANRFVELVYRERLAFLQGEPLLVPATWWEHLKRDRAPAWFLRRFPVRYQIFEAIRFLEGLAFPEHAHEGRIVTYDRFREAK